MIAVYVVEDWVVIYKNGKSVFQGHSVDLGELAKFAGFEYSYNEGNAIDDIVMELGRFPSNQADLKETE